MGGNATDSTDEREAAFRELVERHGRMVFRVAYRITGNEADAEDVAQETFLKAYRSFDRFDSRASFSTWIFRIASNCAIDVLRRRKTRPEVPSDVEGPEFPAPVSADPTPHAALLSAAARRPAPGGARRAVAARAHGLRAPPLRGRADRGDRALPRRRRQRRQTDRLPRRAQAARGARAPEGEPPMNHPTEDELVLHYYGEGESARPEAIRDASRRLRGLPRAARGIGGGPGAIRPARGARPRRLVRTRALAAAAAAASRSRASPPADLRVAGVGSVRLARGAPRGGLPRRPLLARDSGRAGRRFHRRRPRAHPARRGRRPPRPVADRAPRVPARRRGERSRRRAGAALRGGPRRLQPDLPADGGERRRGGARERPRRARADAAPDRAQHDARGARSAPAPYRIGRNALQAPHPASAARPPPEGGRAARLRPFAREPATASEKKGTSCRKSESESVS